LSWINHPLARGRAVPGADTGHDSAPMTPG
jgi:hypothetical protein